jgi:hypothetical protein
VFAEGDKMRVSEQDLRTALTVRMRRRVRRDSTLSVRGVDYEVPFGYLAGQIVTITTSLFDGATPALDLDGKIVPLLVVDPTANSKKRRPPKQPLPQRPNAPVDFNPARTLEGDDDDDDR